MDQEHIGGLTTSCRNQDYGKHGFIHIQLNCQFKQRTQGSAAHINKHKHDHRIVDQAFETKIPP